MRTLQRASVGIGRRPRLKIAWPQGREGSSPSSPTTTQAYVIGVALGDGNLSNPNGRAVRLRITCDAKYPVMNREIISALKELFPDNKVSIVLNRKKTYFNISVYSNSLNEFIPWKVGAGSKEKQRARVPEWIFEKEIFVINCLRGLFQTDGSVYHDRGYLMANFCNNVQELAEDVFTMVSMVGFKPTFHTTTRNGKTKYTVRIARDTDEFLKTIKLKKV